MIVESDGEPMTQLINAELSVQSRDGVKVEKIAWGGSRCYPVDRPSIDNATLTVRDSPDGKRRTIPRHEWKFAVLSPNGEPKFDPVHVYLSNGYEKGKLYELIYTAKHPRVVGLGLAAVRDAISFFHFERSDEAGNSNPLVLNGKPDAQFAYIFGISQSGRFTTQMIYQGFHVDEQGRMVFEGARPHVAGGGKGGFNYRFAQTTHHQKHLQGNYFWADHFPFHFTREGELQDDPQGQANRKTGDVLAVAKKLGKIPKIMISNHEGEYWTRSASLVHTSVDGKSDAQLHKNVRVYMINGVRHGTPSRGSRRISNSSEHALNQLDPRPVGRALLVALDQWVSKNVEPPKSRVPRLDKRELISARTHQRLFPKIPTYTIDSSIYRTARHPGTNLRPPRVDLGPRFWTEGVQDYVPPKTYGPRFVTLVPMIDDDGNPIGGIRLPRLAVPLGTFQGFNLRHASIGAPKYLKAFESSFWPFASTQPQREELEDSRRSIAERYRSKIDYVEQIKSHTNQLVDERLMLREDADAVIDFANSMAWPPKPQNAWPFWVVEKR